MIGSSPSAEIALPTPYLIPDQARIIADQGAYWLSGGPLQVNGETWYSRRPLGHRDLITLGPAELEVWIDGR